MSTQEKSLFNSVYTPINDAISILLPIPSVSFRHFFTIHLNSAAMAAVDLMNDIVATVATELAFNSPGFNGGCL
ncbi:MAG: hypothetical protein KZQ87_06465 [Candidatus Thiodiazotropha sp. (ex Cardiolucina cf. quadrata)]|nr:hypothetical protein [Candidatus Thiodiazotropha sp. (ex Cardiolucina cf. quadrata)]